MRSRVFSGKIADQEALKEIVTESFVSRDGVCVVVDRANDRVEMVVRVCVVSFSGFDSTKGNGREDRHGVRVDAVD